MRDKNGRFIKGHKQWLGKKRPNLLYTNATKTMFKKEVRNNPEGEFKRYGKELSYFGLHRWVERKLGLSRNCTCSFCGSNKRVEWANISFKYQEDRNDWISLCKKCHIKYDRENGWGIATRRYQL